MGFRGRRKKRENNVNAAVFTTHRTSSNQASKATLGHLAFFCDRGE